jgi:endonuclease-8
MPEGHTIHRIAREHRAHFVGDDIRVSSPQGRFIDAERLDGRSLRSVEAYGKHLFYEFDGRRYVHVHLGLFGKVRTAAQPAPSPVSTVRMRLAVPDWYADLIGPTRCQLIGGDQRTMLLARLGPDPLRRAQDPERAWRRIAKSSQPIGALLMDQSVVAGIGNVYRAEFLFRARLDPFRPGVDVEHEQWLGIWQDALVLMRAGVKSGRIVTTELADREHLSRIARATDAHYVYGRTGMWCRRCHTPIRSTEMAGRNLYWCPTCQQ